MIFHSVGNGIIIPTDSHIFRGVGIPTSFGSFFPHRSRLRMSFFSHGREFLLPAMIAMIAMGHLFDRIQDNHISLGYNCECSGTTHGNLHKDIAIYPQKLCLKPFKLHQVYYIYWLVVWNMNFIFPSLGNVIIPTDFHIFQRGRYTTNHIYIYILYPLVI